MNDYESNLGQGVLFPMQSKKSEKSPDFMGRLGLLGGEHVIMAWKQKSKAGKVFIRIQVAGPNRPLETQQTATSDPDDPLDDI